MRTGPIRRTDWLPVGGAGDQLSRSLQSASSSDDEQDLENEQNYESEDDLDCVYDEAAADDRGHDDHDDAGSQRESASESDEELREAAFGPLPMDFSDGCSEADDLGAIRQAIAPRDD